MKPIVALVLAFAACGGPTQQQLVESPSARTHVPATEAPAASTSDRDREALRNQFDDMETTQRARKEAASANGSAATPVVPGGAPDSDKKPVKKGPAVEAPK